MYAQASAKYLAGIDATVRRARFLATKQDREKVGFNDIKCAIQEGVIPSDSAFTQALGKPNQIHARRLHLTCNGTAEQLQIGNRHLLHKQMDLS